VNLLATDDAQTSRWSELTRSITREAVARGGTVAAEHGIGKTKRELLADLHPAWVIRAMRAVKRELDPKGLLAPGNLFDASIAEPVRERVLAPAG
jgi:FAD/FMN-containing dehydrogenase